MQAPSQVQKVLSTTIRWPHLDTCSAHVPDDPSLDDPSLDGSLGPPLTEESHLSTWPGAPHTLEGGFSARSAPTPAEHRLGCLLRLEVELVRGTACPQGAREKLSVGLSLTKRKEQLFTRVSISQRGCAGPWV